MSTTFNVLRYSLFGAGIVYGAYHRYSLESDVEKQKFLSSFAHEQKLINKAKKEYAKLTAPKATTGDAINWEDPNLDFGKALETLVQKLE
ncbi:ATP synthase subunit e, mitochondrial [[Candida] jaroonii]|uniref:ATP synthase subunit e, mitochondrial n=1 Tax=[Candida] jaroonii TaxID=467808 RepID=A0ACA9Y9M1_9ASCO|nr:ATP synthase subunit e, mitochondrial [[Candida] jaroonii]